ncbi:ras-like protein rasD [Rhopilema esculentum]|uniref:ras-like protein rasD n=1 Tax=Rhopilema esculentum TaxID=499914 RepID=UPI0031DF3AF2|eukprot:gene4593-20861_t
MLRVCVVGSGGVGKSCVTLRFLKDEFTEYYDPTMEETYQTEMIYSGRSHEVEIVDTAGQEEFTSFLDSSLATGDAFMILYAINSLSSWNELKTLRSKINQETESLGNRKVPIIVVGNKRDLEDERISLPDDPEEYAASIDVPYIETSAKTGFNVKEAFQLMLRQVEAVQPDLLLRKKPSTRDRKQKDCVLL